MNVRHHIFLSRDETLYPHLTSSLSLHQRIVEDLEQGRWASLGRRLSEYMALRAAFDPQALSPALSHFFALLREERLIYGGTLTGAMGGGVAVLIPTATGLKPDAHTGRTPLELALESLRSYRDGQGQRCFDNPHFGRIHYQLNTTGLVGEVTTEAFTGGEGPAGASLQAGPRALQKARHHKSNGL
jgi:hypothetical protein